MCFANKLACQILDLIDKPVTGPLWRTMVKENEVVDMSLHYQKLHDFFKQCATDPSLFSDGTNLLFPELIVEDDWLTSQHYWILNQMTNIVCTGELSFTIEKDKMKITYWVFCDIFSIIDEELFSLKNVIAPCFLVVWMECFTFCWKTIHFS